MARDSLKCRFSYLEWEGWVDQGLICTENVVGILEKIHESLAQCLNILDREGLSLEYDPLYDIYTRIARLREDYNNNWLYGCELANQVEKELDMPYYNAYVNGATEVIGNIHVQDITTKNTLGLKDYDGREIDKLTLAAFLGLRDDEGVPSMSRQVVEEKQYYVEEFATLFAELYSDYQIDETGAELEEFLESLYEQGSFSHDIDDKELALWETVLSFSIIVPMIEAFTGEEMLTGNELSDFERIFSGAGAVVDIVGLGMTIKAVRRWWKLRKVDDVVDAANVHHLVGTGYADDVVEGGLDASIKNIDEFIGGNKSFDEVLDDYAKVYADKINSNQAWSWDDTIPGGENLTKKQRSIIKQQAIDDGLIPDIKVTKVDGMRYGFADFESAGVVKETQYLPENMWKMSDAEQFKWLDEQIGGTVEGYTWHHTEIPGKMQLVPTGIHNITTHNGGRTAGMWADAPR